MTAAEIVHACLETDNRAAWAAFVRRFQPVIAASVARVVRRYGVPMPALVDDLTQETYLRICKENCRILRDFQARHEDAIFGYIKVIATSVALDHFRARATQKRKGEMDEGGADIEAKVSPTAIETSALLEELDRHLASSETERDRTIFWLYYRQGYTTKDIAAMPHLELSQKGVESCIYRLTQALRGAVAGSASRAPDPSKGKSLPGALGVME
jgi:RNA polymerase sigma-70 factor (ECF subfamily)